METIGFYPGDILLPREGFPNWAVVACDQFTSQPEYWQQVEQQVNGHPSTYGMVFPEAYLEMVDFDEKIASINQTMEQYDKDGVFREYPNCMVYVERTLKNGKVRKGVVGLLDLEQYDFNKGSTSLVRATEGTILDRLPPRIRIRENALLESPHIVVLIDDEQDHQLEHFHEVIAQREKLYDFDLMQQGGHISGYRLTDEDVKQLQQSLSRLADPKHFQEKYGVEQSSPLVFAVGDGNHSLATAKRCYEDVKRSLPLEQALQHPARYALVELNNLHDESLEFEAIHRAVFGVDAALFLQEILQYCQNVKGPYPEQQFELVIQGTSQPFTIPHPEHTLTIGSIQQFLDEYVSRHGGKVDYIHGKDVVKSLSEKGAVGILAPCMQKSELFRTVILEGALPRKTFSMGEACDKRYYLECRKIR